MKIVKISADNLAAQTAALQAALDAGWRLETEPEKVAARYRDYDLAEQVPRAIMYADLGILLGRLQQIELALREQGIQIKSGS